jgi:peptidoglycan/xylan/chitin deacetylase (PgdA/CDA1 family)
MIFAHAELRRFFAALASHSEVLSFAAAIDAGRSLAPRTAILRHDVDIDIEAAVAMAEIEAEFGIRSTFFFLTGCDTYNAASAANRRHLRRLTEQGFEVALHFDPLLYPGLADEELLPAVRREADWLGEIAGRPVRSISLHNPSVHGRYPAFKDFINAYDPAFFDPKRYLSDSCMGFRGKDPFEFIREREQQPVQILLHPFHYSDRGGGYPELYTRFLKRFADRIDETMKVNDTYVRQMDGRPLWDYSRG